MRDGTGLMVPPFAAIGVLFDVVDSEFEIGTRPQSFEPGDEQVWTIYIRELSRAAPSESLKLNRYASACSSG